MLKVGSRLAGKVAIVTGGGSGYGAGIAKRFAQEGAKVVIADINEEHSQRIASSQPDSLSFHKTNVTTESDWESLFKGAKSCYGPVTTLVNNAGTSYKNKPTTEVTLQDFEKRFDVNVKGVYFGSQIFLKRALKNGTSGVMLNIASLGATRPRPGLVWYNASKGAIWNVTKGLAAEYGPHKIRVNFSVSTSGRHRIAHVLNDARFEAFSGMPDTPENRGKSVSNVPLGRLCEATDVANVALFLASDEAQFITGINLEVEGGRAV